MKHGMAPSQMWTLFVYLDAVHTPMCLKQRRKLNPKTRKCVLLGYGTVQKGYCLYDLCQKKVIHSRDVVFDETSMPGIKTETNSLSEYVELEVEEEPSVEPMEITHIPDDTSEETSGMEQAAADESVVSSPTPAELTLRRSTLIRQEPDRYVHNLALTLTEQDSLSAAEAKSSSDSAMWEEAMEREMKSLQQNRVWELVPLPPDQKVVGSKWVFKRKVDTSGIVERYKAHLVTQGCTQRYGLDYEEMFSPVVRFESI